MRIRNTRNNSQVTYYQNVQQRQHCVGFCAIEILIYCVSNLYRRFVRFELMYLCEIFNRSCEGNSSQRDGEREAVGNIRRRKVVNLIRVVKMNTITRKVMKTSAVFSKPATLPK